MLFTVILQNQVTTAAQSADGQVWSFPIMMISIIAIMYFMIIRPQQKRAKELQALIASVKKGDRVVTSAGMHGTVYEIDDSTVTVTIAPNCNVKFDKTAIGNVLSNTK